MKHNLSEEDYKLIISEQGKACKKLNEIIKKKNKEILELNKEVRHYKSYSKKLEKRLLNLDKFGLF